MTPSELRYGLLTVCAIVFIYELWQIAGIRAADNALGQNEAALSAVIDEHYSWPNVVGTLTKSCFDGFTFGIFSEGIFTEANKEHHFRTESIAENARLNTARSQYQLELHSAAVWRNWSFLIGLLVLFYPMLVSKTRTVPSSDEYIFRGLAHGSNGAIDQAIADFAKAIEIAPNSAVAYCNRGIALGSKGEYAKAIADFSRAIEINPHVALVHFNRGKALDETGQFDKAIADYDECIRLDSKDVSAYIGRGNSLSQKGEIDMAIADFNHALEFAPREALAYYNRGVAWNKKGEFAKAIADYDECIRLDPKDPVAYCDRGDAWNNQGEFDGAISDYKKAIELNPAFQLGYAKLAWLRSSCPNIQYRDGKHAVDLATNACNLTSWNDPSEFVVLGAAYAEIGDFDSATKWVTKAIDQNLAPSLREIAKNQLILYREAKPYREHPKIASTL